MYNTLSLIDNTPSHLVYNMHWQPETEKVQWYHALIIVLETLHGYRSQINFVFTKLLSYNYTQCRNNLYLVYFIIPLLMYAAFEFQLYAA